MFLSITVFIEHTCAVGNCKHKRIPCRQLSLDEVFVDYITFDGGKIKRYIEDSVRCSVDNLLQQFKISTFDLLT